MDKAGRMMTHVLYTRASTSQVFPTTGAQPGNVDVALSRHVEWMLGESSRGGFHGATRRIQSDSWLSTHGRPIAIAEPPNSTREAVCNPSAKRANRFINGAPCFLSDLQLPPCLDRTDDPSRPVAGPYSTWSGSPLVVLPFFQSPPTWLEPPEPRGRSTTINQFCPT